MPIPDLIWVIWVDCPSPCLRVQYMDTVPWYKWGTFPRNVCNVSIQAGHPSAVAACEVGIEFQVKTSWPHEFVDFCSAYMCLQRRLICKYFAWLNILDCGGWRHCLCSSWLVCRWPMSPCWNSGLGWSRSTWRPLQTPRFLWPLCANWLGNNEHKRMERVTETLQKASRLNLAHVSTTQSQRNHNFLPVLPQGRPILSVHDFEPYPSTISILTLKYVEDLWSIFGLVEELQSCRSNARFFHAIIAGYQLGTLALPPGTKGEELTSRGWAESRTGETSMDFGFSFLLHSGSMLGLIISVNACDVLPWWFFGLYFWGLKIFMFVKPAANVPLLLMCKKRVQFLNQFMSAKNG